MRILSVHSKLSVSERCLYDWRGSLTVWNFTGLTVFNKIMKHSPGFCKMHFPSTVGKLFIL